uniref:Uncharacterized protein n=1 Tax=Meloidogyne hapla TaxID=6305 RepID=A0A1I8B907_MELHA
MTSEISSSGIRPSCQFVLVKRGAAPCNPTHNILNSYKCQEWVSSTSSSSQQNINTKIKKETKQNVYIRTTKQPLQQPPPPLLNNKNNSSKNPYISTKPSTSSKHSEKHQNVVELLSPKDYFNAQSKLSSQLAGRERTRLQFKSSNQHFDDLLLEDHSNVQMEVERLLKIY